MIKACGGAGDIDEAFSMYHLATAHGLVPTIATYGTLMAAAAKVGDAARALAVWDWIRQAGIRPNTTCVNVLLAALEQDVRSPSHSFLSVACSCHACSPVINIL